MACVRAEKSVNKPVFSGTFVRVFDRVLHITRAAACSEKFFDQRDICEKKKCYAEEKKRLK
jgi:hypothetical protein